MRGNDIKATLGEDFRQFDGTVFVGVANTEQCRTLGWQNYARCQLRLGICLAKRAPYTHHFTCGLHFRSKNWIGTGKSEKREYRFFD